MGESPSSRRNSKISMSLCMEVLSIANSTFAISYSYNTLCPSSGMRKPEKSICSNK